MKTSTLPALLVLLTAAALHAAALFLQPSLTWGFHFLRFVGPVWIAAWALAIALLAAAAVTRRIDPILGILGRASQRPLRFIGIGLGAFIALGFVFRVDVPLLGDSWYLVTNFAGALRGTDEVLPRDEPLATWFLSGVLSVFRVRSYPDFLTAFFVAGMFLGSLFVVLVFATTRILWPGPVRRAVAFIGAAGPPAAVLFFGYVETYAVVLLALAAFLLAGLLHLRGRVPFWVVALIFLVMALTHYLTVITFPALAWLGWRDLKANRAKEVWIGTAAVCVAVSLLLLAVGFDVSNYFSQVPHRHYLPIQEPTDPVERYSSPYTLFSPWHFLDLANLALLLVPTAIGLGVVGLFSRKPAEETAAPAGRQGLPDAMFLALMLLPALAFAFVAKFDLGAARDWDVLAPFSYPLILLGFAWLFRRMAGGTRDVEIAENDETRAAAIVVASGLVHACLWWGVTGAGDAAVARFRSLTDERLIGQGGMYSANLYLSRYYRQVGRDERESAELWLDYIWRYPDDVRGFRNVLVNTRSEGAPAAAEKIRGWSRAFGKNPRTDQTMTELAVESGNEALASGALDDAEVFYRVALEVNEGNAAAWNNLGTVRARRDDFGEAAGMFTRAVEADPGFGDAWFNLGRTMLALGRAQEARGAFEQAARLGNRSAKSLLTDGVVRP